jgi:hypothetical protein
MKRLWLCLPVVVLCLPLLIFLTGASSRSADSQPSGPVVFSEVEAPAPDDPMAELAKEHPIEFLEKCLQRYDKEVQGYDCVLQKHERIDGTLQPKEVTEIHFREQPFSVTMRWVQGARKADAVMYVTGENDNKLLARPSGALARRIVGEVVTRDVDGSDAKASGRVTLNRFGMKNALTKTIKQWQAAHDRGALQVEYLGIQIVKELDDRPCYVFRRTYDQEEDGVTQLTTYLDEETLLQTGSILKGKDGQLIATYFFRDIKLNPTFTPGQFQPAALKP